MRESEWVGKRLLCSNYSYYRTGKKTPSKHSYSFCFSLIAAFFIFSFQFRQQSVTTEAKNKTRRKWLMVLINWYIPHPRYGSNNGRIKSAYHPLLQDSYPSSNPFYSLLIKTALTRSLLLSSPQFAPYELEVKNKKKQKQPLIDIL